MDDRPADTVSAIRRIAEGDDGPAWTRIADSHGLRLHRIAAAILDDHAGAEDVVQDAMLVLRRDAAGFRGTDDHAAAAWLDRIVVHLALHRRRSDRNRLRRERLANTAAPTVVEDDPSAAAVQDEEATLLRRELASLPERDRVPLALHFIVGLGHAEVASALRCSVNNARVRVHRALKRLGARLQAGGLGLGAAEIASRLGRIGDESARLLADAVLRTPPAATSLASVPAIPQAGATLRTAVALIGPLGCALLALGGVGWDPGAADLGAYPAGIGGGAAEAQEVSWPELPESLAPLRDRPLESRLEGDGERYVVPTAVYGFGGPTLFGLKMGPGRHTVIDIGDLRLVVLGTPFSGVNRSRIDVGGNGSSHGESSDHGIVLIEERSEGGTYTFRYRRAVELSVRDRVATLAERRFHLDDGQTQLVVLSAGGRVLGIYALDAALLRAAGWDEGWGGGIFVD